MRKMEDKEIERLLGLARDKSDAGRERLINTVSDLFTEDEQTLTERERALMTDILNQLIREVEMTVRRHLSERVSVLPHAPRELILTLANDAIDVARPILLKRESFTMLTSSRSFISAPWSINLPSPCERTSVSL